MVELGFEPRPSGSHLWHVLLITVTCLTMGEGVLVILQKENLFYSPFGGHTARRLRYHLLVHLEGRVPEG